MNSSTFKIVSLAVIFVLLTSVTVFGLFKSNSSLGAGLSEEEVKKIVKEYIANNGDAILESVSNYQQRSQMEKEKNAQENIAKMQDSLENNPTSPVAGNVDGDVTVIEFFDYSCGYCKRAIPSVGAALEDGNVKFVFKEFPILGAKSYLAAKAALAVNSIAPEKYYEFHKEVMKSRVSGKDGLLELASKLGIDAEKVAEKMESSEIQEIIDSNKQIASSIGVRGTPAFIINGQLVSGAIDASTMKSKIAEARASSK